MAFFGNEIAQATILAYFVPLVMSSGGNSGSQASTLIIQAMAVGEVKLNDWWRRSEEHTSELQSPCNLVCRLLLEKKKPTATKGRTSLQRPTPLTPHLSQRRPPLPPQTLIAHTPPLLHPYKPPRARRVHTPVASTP